PLGDIAAAALSEGGGGGLGAGGAFGAFNAGSAPPAFAPAAASEGPRGGGSGNPTGTPAAAGPGVPPGLGQPQHGTRPPAASHAQRQPRYEFIVYFVWKEPQPAGAANDAQKK